MVVFIFFSFTFKDLILINKPKFSKDLILSNYFVLKNIFINQLHLNYEVNFDECLYLIYDDQKTVKLIYEYKHEQTEIKSVYNYHK